MVSSKNHITWHTDNRIVDVQVTGDQTMADLRALNTTIMTLLDDGNAPVHMLIDMTEAGDIPSNIREVKQVFTYLDHLALGWSLFIGVSNPLHKLVISLTNQLSGVQASVTSTKSAALEQLRRVDQSLAAD